MIDIYKVLIYNIIGEISYKQILTHMKFGCIVANFAVSVII